MDALNKNDTVNCAGHLHIKKIVSAFAGKDAIRQQTIFWCLKKTCQELFVEKFLAPLQMAYKNTLAGYMEDCFEQALSGFFSEVRQKKVTAKNSDYKEILFRLFKHCCLLRLNTALKARCISGGNAVVSDFDPDITTHHPVEYELSTRMAKVLKELEQPYRDYFVWYYVNKFNIAQISVITGKAAGLVEQNLWNCIKAFRKAASRYFILLKEPFLEQEYFLMSKYFDTLLSDEDDKLFAEYINYNEAFRINFELELNLRFGINSVSLLQHLYGQPGESADHFLTRVSRIAESS